MVQKNDQKFFLTSRIFIFALCLCTYSSNGSITSRNKLKNVNNLKEIENIKNQRIFAQIASHLYTGDIENPTEENSTPGQDANTANVQQPDDLPSLTRRPAGDISSLLESSIKILSSREPTAEEIEKHIDKIADNVFLDIQKHGKGEITLIVSTMARAEENKEILDRLQNKLEELHHNKTVQVFHFYRNVGEVVINFNPYDNKTSIKKIIQDLWKDFPSVWSIEPDQPIKAAINNHAF